MAKSLMSADANHRQCRDMDEHSAAMLDAPWAYLDRFLTAKNKIDPRLPDAQGGWNF